MKIDKIPEFDMADFHSADWTVNILCLWFRESQKCLLSDPECLILFRLTWAKIRLIVSKFSPKTNLFNVLRPSELLRFDFLTLRQLISKIFPLWTDFTSQKCYLDQHRRFLEKIPFLYCFVKKLNFVKNTVCLLWLLFLYRAPFGLWNLVFSSYFDLLAQLG